MEWNQVHVNQKIGSIITYNKIKILIPCSTHLPGFDILINITATKFNELINMLPVRILNIRVPFLSKSKLKGREH